MRATEGSASGSGFECDTAHDHSGFSLHTSLQWGEGFEVDRTAEGGVSLRRKMNAAKESYWFKKPVDPVADGVPNYFTFIKKPMDLGTMKQKLSLHQYS